jgi:hypothetical protein
MRSSPGDPGGGGRGSMNVASLSRERSTKPCRHPTSATRDGAIDSFESVRAVRSSHRGDEWTRGRGVGGVIHTRMSTSRSMDGATVLDARNEQRGAGYPRRRASGSRTRPFVTLINSIESVATSVVALAEPRHSLADRSVDRLITSLESRPPQPGATWTRSERVDPASQTVVCLVACRSILQRRQALEQQ